MDRDLAPPTEFKWLWLKIVPFSMGLMALAPSIRPYRGWLYLAMLTSALAINIISLRVAQGMGFFSLNLRRNIPTYAGMARVIICLFLMFPYAGEVYRDVQWVPLLYLLYTASLCSLYDRPQYHYTSARVMRIIADILLSGLLFEAFNGLTNIAWITFLVPITTLARYYSQKWAYLTAAVSWLAITVIGTNYDIGGFATFVIRTLSFAIHNGSYENLKFGEFIAESKALEQWTTLKELGLVGVIFFVVVLIYQEETRKRLGSVFDFGYTLLMAVQMESLTARPTAVDSGDARLTGVILGPILDLLCVEINSELVIAVQDSEASDRRWVTAAFQTHGMAAERLEPLRWEDASRNAYEELIVALDLPVNRRKHSSPNFRKTLQNIAKKAEKDANQSTGGSIVGELGLADRGAIQRAYESSDLWVFSHPGDQSWLGRVGEVFFQFETSGSPVTVPEKIAKFRDRSRLYNGFKVVSVAVMRVPGWRLFFVNNLPSNYRVVPRIFWDDGIEKLQLASLILHLKASVSTQ